MGKNHVSPSHTDCAEVVDAAPTCPQPATAGAEMRRYHEQRRGEALIRVGSGFWMFGSGN